MSHEIQKDPEQLGKHVADPRVGGEFNDYDPKGQLPTALKIPMGQIMNSVRSVDTLRREPTEIVRIESVNPQLGEHQLSFLDTFANHIARSAMKKPRHRKGDDVKREKAKHRDEKPDLIMPL